jgi:uncharacterized protein (UPF0335 family)
MDNDKQHKYTTHSTYTGIGCAICGRIIAEHGVEGEAAPAPQAATQQCPHCRGEGGFDGTDGGSCEDCNGDGTIPVSQAEAPRPSAPNAYAKVAARNLRFYAELIERGEIDAKNVEALSESVFIHSLREYASYIERLESRPSAEEQMCVISATGDGARTWIVPASRLHDELHKAYCCCGVASWRECQTNGVIDMVTAIDDEDNWSHDYPDYQRHIYADHGEDTR